MRQIWLDMAKEQIGDLEDTVLKNSQSMQQVLIKKKLLGTCGRFMLMYGKTNIFTIFYNIVKQLASN